LGCRWQLNIEASPGQATGSGLQLPGPGLVLPGFAGERLQHPSSSPNLSSGQEQDLGLSPSGAAQQAGDTEVFPLQVKAREAEGPRA